MLEDHAIVQREGFRVPLIGILPTAVLETCDLCGDQFPLGRVMLCGSQMLCDKCRMAQDDETPDYLSAD